MGKKNRQPEQPKSVANPPREKPLDMNRYLGQLQRLKTRYQSASGQAQGILTDANSDTFNQIADMMGKLLQDYNRIVARVNLLEDEKKNAIKKPPSTAEGITPPEETADGEHAVAEATSPEAPETPPAK